MLPDTQKYAEQLLKAESKMKEIEKIKDQRNLAAMMTQFPISITLN